MGKTGTDSEGVRKAPGCKEAKGERNSEIEKEEWESNCGFVMYLSLACEMSHTPHDGPLSEFEILPRSPSFHSRSCLSATMIETNKSINF
jgi:hypothetical protein